MKDFDSERSKRGEWPEESFQIAGSTFRLKPQMPVRALSAYADLELYASEKRAMQPKTFETLTEVVRESLHQDDQEAWAELLESDLPNPITLEDMLDIANFIVTESAKRPTSPLSASGNTAESGGTKLTVASVSPVEAEPKVSTSEVG